MIALLCLFAGFAFGVVLMGCIRGGQREDDFNAGFDAGQAVTRNARAMSDRRNW